MYKKTKRKKLGWEVFVEFIDGTTECIALKDAKNSNPIESSEYAVVNNIDQETAVKWWDGFLLRKRNIVINKVKRNYWRTTHKFVLRVPKSVLQALKIDKKNGNYLWEKSIKKEMSKMSVAYAAIDNCTLDQVR